MKIIENLSFDIDGNVVNVNGDRVHLRQGDLDGACGPYCSAMALLIHGVLSRNDLSIPSKVDYRTLAGRFWAEIGTKDPLVHSGTDHTELIYLFEKYKKHLDVEALENTSKNIFQFCQEAISDNSPVVLDVNGKVSDGLNHWVLAIGFIGNSLLLLDPSEEIKPGAFWNAALLHDDSASGHFRYNYVSGDFSCKVKMTKAIKIMSKNKAYKEALK